ncbi:hypothetical protein KALB_1384 [Kutzneria albida DSM 43870]|uniref:Uncharacterized protein n=1 Tax=Kutzneria albida DSM 43870 TaxID=1449976 RepID=W5W1P0_9PSEU|nr:hypothetical protein KALB_1384 [Kutzneria albida DSM 43870]
MVMGQWDGNSWAEPCRLLSPTPVGAEVRAATLPRVALLVKARDGGCRVLCGGRHAASYAMKVPFVAFNATNGTFMASPMRR